MHGQLLRRPRHRQRCIVLVAGALALAATPGWAQTATPTASPVPTITPTPTIHAGHGAGVIYRPATAFGDVAGAGCALTPRDDSGVRTYVRRCPGQQNETLLVDDWSYPQENPATLRVRLEFFESYDNQYSITPTRTSGPSTPTPTPLRVNQRARCFETSCACAAETESYLNLTYSSPARAASPAGIYPSTLHIRPLNPILSCANAAAGRKCRLRITRVLNDPACLDNSPGSLDVSGVYLSWAGAKIPECTAMTRGYITWGDMTGTFLSAPQARSTLVPASWIHGEQTLPWPAFEDLSQDYTYYRNQLISLGGEYKAWLDSLDDGRARLIPGQSVHVPFVSLSPEEGCLSGNTRSCVARKAPDPNWSPSSRPDLYQCATDAECCDVSLACQHVRKALAKMAWFIASLYDQKGEVVNVLLVIEANTYSPNQVGNWQDVFARTKTLIANDVNLQNALVGVTWVTAGLNSEACGVTQWDSCWPTGPVCPKGSECTDPNVCRSFCHDCTNRNQTLDEYYNAFVTNAPQSERPDYFGISSYYDPPCILPESLLPGYYKDWSDDSQLPIYVEEAGFWFVPPQRDYAEGVRWYEHFYRKLCEANAARGKSLHVAVDGPYESFVTSIFGYIPWPVTPQRYDGTYRPMGWWFDSLP